VREPYLRAAERPGSSESEKEEAIRGLVVALPAGGENPLLERFPALARNRNWPTAAEREQLAVLVKEQLQAGVPPLRERYRSPAAADEVRAMLLGAGRLPPALKLGSLPSVPDSLPPSLHDAFMGRDDDLWRVHEALAGRRTVCCIEAAPGLGKTRLALEYVYRLGARHFGGIFWIDARRAAGPQLRAVLRGLEAMAPACAVSDVEGRGAGKLRHRLSWALGAISADATPPLFVADALPGQARSRSSRLLRTWCPAVGRASAVVTSQTLV
jgi:hypothetical protein